jgi:hypothetical protein
MGKISLGNIDKGVDPEQIADAVGEYLDENPIPSDEPLLSLHLEDPTPHPVYDNLASGRFVTYLQNGLSNGNNTG